MVRDTLLGFPSHTLPYRYRKSCHFIDSLRLSHKRWLSPIINHVIARPVRKLVVAIRIPDGPFCRTSCYASVGADAHIGPPYRTLNTASVGADASVRPYALLHDFVIGPGRGHIDQRVHRRKYPEGDK